MTAREIPEGDAVPEDAAPAIRRCGRKVSPGLLRCRTRFGGVYLFGVIFLLASFLLRTLLLLRCGSDMDGSLWTIGRAYLLGGFYDVLALCYVVAPVVVLLLLAPDRVFRCRIIKVLLAMTYSVAVAGVLFDVAAEWIFWGEFSSRFNFIAVDYLVYTHELFANIWESYPVVGIMSGILLGAVLIVAATWRAAMGCFQSTSSLRQRLLPGGALLVVPVVSLLCVDCLPNRIADNHFANELAKNGPYSFVLAFRNNRIDYPQFYLTEADVEAFRRMRGLLEPAGGAFVSGDPFDLTRQVSPAGPEKRHNVILIVVESLSAKFLGALGGPGGLTPNLDALAARSLFFTHLYATGTRTTRGLEAIALSLPPTPGRSLVKRPDNAGLFSIGHLLRKRRYEAKFLYGGYGYFDNMNAFFASNGFETVDRADMSEGEITFSNAWGACDGDLFRRTLKEGDRAHAAGDAFCFLVMTTSNHRPYTFPAGKIDLPQGHRSGAVKYTDYAIGEFIRQAETKPWFAQTLFVILADHCANSAGNTEVPLREYHIPMLIHAPHLIQPRVIGKPASQMDVAPTLAGLLNWSYRSKFFGRDILQPGDSQVLLGTYQKLGLFSRGKLTLLLPKKAVRTYEISEGQPQRGCPDDVEQVRDAISCYQSAAYLIARRLYTPE